MKPTIKTKDEITVMAEGGEKLARVRDCLKEAVKVGGKASEVERLATALIEKAGGKPSFKMVAGYSWSVCVNINDGVVHGIPHPEIVFNEGDIVSVDVGMYYKGFHTDTSFTLLLGKDTGKRKFLNVGKSVLANAIARAKVGNTVGDISASFEHGLKKHGYSPIRDLTGHGIGRDLHEAPLIPCFVSGSREEVVRLEEGMTLAIEAMYSAGSSELRLDPDGWTLSTKDGKLAGLFEETVAVTHDGPVVLTAETALHS